MRDDVNPGPDPLHVASPCISVCAIDPASGLCMGCCRTLEEIAGWIELDRDARRALVAALPARRARLAPVVGTKASADAQR